VKAERESKWRKSTHGAFIVIICVHDRFKSIFAIQSFAMSTKGGESHFALAMEMPALARIAALPEATPARALSAHCDVRGRDPQCPVNVDTGHPRAPIADLPGKPGRTVKSTPSAF
jgi:hypothetical protein